MHLKKKIGEVYFLVCLAIKKLRKITHFSYDYFSFLERLEIMTLIVMKPYTFRMFESYAQTTTIAEKQCFLRLHTCTADGKKPGMGS